MALSPPPPATLDPGVLAGAAAGLAGTGPITFVVGDDAVTYAAEGGTIAVRPGRHDGACTVHLDGRAWDDLVGQFRTAVNLLLSGDLAFERGGFDQLGDWDPVLRYLHAGIPPFDPARLSLHGRDPRAVFTLDAHDGELADQLRTVGYLHVAGAFGADEMAAADEEIDRLAAAARPGDGRSWWVARDDGSEALCRLVYATLGSPVLAALQDDPRVRRLATLLDPRLRVAADRMEGTAVLLKVPGATSGLSNIPWHQDCGMGGHGFMCPSASVGIQVTGSDAASGNLLVVPGSHGQAVHVRWRERFPDVPVVAVDTEPGDVTVHVQDLVHASPRPTGGGGRRTMYVSAYPPALWEHVGPGGAFNDLVRDRTREVAELNDRSDRSPAPPG